MGTLVRGKYQILTKVGQGGMGIVYKARHVRFNELRALKVISAELASDAAFLRRFEQEAITTRKLQHPNAVRVEDIDESDNGRPFIVMEYIEGRNLKDVIEKEAPLSVPRICSIVKQVAAALDAAHALGIIHRDIKPGNIALVPSALEAGLPTEQAKVFDFGIAKLKEDQLEHSSAHPYRTLTGTGAVIGTPAYMSPEQAKGLKGDQLDGRSDLYSLGVVMYQMLTAELPLKADSTVEQLMAHISTPPKPVREARPELEIPDAVAAVVMQCLEKDRELRPASGRALIDALNRAERLSSQLFAPATPPTRTHAAAPVVLPEAVAAPAPPAMSRARPWAWTGVALFVAVVAGIWWHLQSELRRNELLRMAEVNRRIASANAEPAPNPLLPSKPSPAPQAVTPPAPPARPVTSSTIPAPVVSLTAVARPHPSASPSAHPAPHNGAIQKNQVIVPTATPASNQATAAASSAEIQPQLAPVPEQVTAPATGKSTVATNSHPASPPLTPASEVQPVSPSSQPVAAPTENEPELSPQEVGNRGKAWLDAHKDPPAINVSGSWDSNEWGDLQLTQPGGGREVRGNVTGYELTGVVSGKRLLLLFHSSKGKIDYCATLDSAGDNKLTGGYSSRVTRLRFGHGLCQEKSRPMHMIKK